MSEQETNVINQESDTAPDYISAIQELKANSVTRESYDKLKSENKQLLDALVNGKEMFYKTAIPVWMMGIYYAIIPHSIIGSNVLAGIGRGQLKVLEQRIAKKIFFIVVII